MALCAPGLEALRNPMSHVSTESRDEQCGNGPRPAETPSTPEGSGGSNPPCRIRLTECKDAQDFRLFREIIDTYHTYKPWKRCPGRRISWLIETTGSESVGAIGVHSAVLVLGARDRFIGWNRAQKLLHLTQIANNYRFALKMRGIGSMVLSEFESAAKKRWRERYGERLLLLETLVQPPYTGTSYRAANWIYVGMTKGFAIRRAPVSLWQRAGGERKALLTSNKSLAAEKYASWNGGKLVGSVQSLV